MNKLVMSLMCLVVLSSISCAYEGFRIIPKESDPSEIIYDYYFDVTLRNISYINQGELIPNATEEITTNITVFFRTCFNANRSALLVWQCNITDLSGTNLETKTNEIFSSTSDNLCTIDKISASKDTIHKCFVRTNESAVQFTVYLPSNEIHYQAPTIATYYDLIVAETYELLERNIEIFQIFVAVIKYFSILLSLIIIPSILYRTVLYVLRIILKGS